jgi:hypothetical protein
MKSERRFGLVKGTDELTGFPKTFNEELLNPIAKNEMRIAYKVGDSLPHVVDAYGRAQTWVGSSIEAKKSPTYDQRDRGVVCVYFDYALLIIKPHGNFLVLESVTDTEEGNVQNEYGIYPLSDRSEALCALEATINMVEFGKMILRDQYYPGEEITSSCLAKVAYKAMVNQGFLESGDLEATLKRLGL